MKIVLALHSYRRLTGSEMYVYELSRVLSARGHVVSILANDIGGEIAARTEKNKVKMYEFFGHPDLKPDIVHVQQPHPTAYCLRFFPKTPHVVTIHSEFIHEKPMKDPRIKRYIFVRPEIKEKYKKLSGVLIMNGVDTKRFNNYAIGDQNPKSILFVGTVDQLRKSAIAHLHVYAKQNNFELVIVSPDIKKFIKREYVTYVPSRWDIEGWTKYCGKTASILMGRTTIEGWMCGKPAIIYDIDKDGKILNCREYSVPKKDTLKVFDIEYMTDRVLEVYTSV